MKTVIQRVKKASVSVDGVTCGSIDNGYVVLAGFGAEDDKKKVESAVDKIHKLRIFQDDGGKTNLSIGDVKGGLLIISQFTLYADCKKGNRPSFVNAAGPDKANELYEYFIECAEGRFEKVAHGVFGAYMQVELINDGPFTVILES